MPEYLKDISIINHNNKALELEFRSDKSAWHISFNVLENMSVFLSRLQLDVEKAMSDVQTRAAEHRNEAVGEGAGESPKSLRTED